jgi:hypothetical protein
MVQTNSHRGSNWKSDIYSYTEGLEDIGGRLAVPLGFLGFLIRWFRPNPNSIIYGNI